MSLVSRGIWMRAALVAVAVALWCVAAWPAVAHAQTTSVRQAKLVTTDANGNPLLNDIAVATTAVATSTRSFDTTAFGSAVLVASRVSGDCGSDMEDLGAWEIPGVYGWIRVVSTYNSGTGTITVQVETASSQSGSFAVIVRPYAQNRFTGIVSTCVYDVSLTLVPIAGTVVSVGPVPADLAILETALYPVVGGGVTATPVGGQVTVLPFIMEEPSGALLVTGDVTPAGYTPGPYTSIPPNDITTVETAATMTTALRATLQNNGTAMALCRITTDVNATVDVDTYSFSLAAASAVNNGSGSTWTAPTVPNATTYIRCIGSGGTARVSGFTHP